MLPVAVHYSGAGSVAAPAVEHHDPEDETEVIPPTVVVHFVDVHIIIEQ
jgi:hypothetical protein